MKDLKIRKSVQRRINIPYSKILQTTPSNISAVAQVSWEESYVWKSG